MIRPERDPHWLLGVEHGRNGLEPYTFQDAENQRRYAIGYVNGRIERDPLLAAHPEEARQAPFPQISSLQMQQTGPRYPWKP